MSINNLVLLCCLVSAVLCDGEKYTDKFDHINVKEIVENKRLLTAYVDCILDRGKCTPEGKELKEHLADAIETGCEKCTEAQKNGTYIVIEHLITHEKAIWEELCAKFDPSGKYRKKYEDLAKEKGLKIPE